MNIEKFKVYLENDQPSRKRDNQDIVSRAKRVEKVMGDLDEAYAYDKCAGIISQLTYSSQDFKTGVQPLHPITIKGNPYTGTLCLKRAVEVFVQFKNSTGAR